MLAGCETSDVVSALRDLAQKLRLQNELSLLVLLTRLVCLVVLPAHRLFALFAVNVTYDVPACSHIALTRLSRCDVDDAIEQICFAMLATEILLSISMGRSR